MAYPCVRDLCVRSLSCLRLSSVLLAFADSDADV